MFAAPFQGAAFREALGFDLTVAQTNHSVSARGVIRGVHFADVPPGQAKYVYCPRGALLDVVVDVRVGSPTFGRFEAVELDGRSCRAVYLAEGLGHAFVALEDDTVMAYLCSTPYNPGAEHGVSPLDPALGLPWPADTRAGAVGEGRRGTDARRGVDGRSAAPVPRMYRLVRAARGMTLSWRSELADAFQGEPASHDVHRRQDVPAQTLAAPTALHAKG